MPKLTSSRAIALRLVAEGKISHTVEDERHPTSARWHVEGYWQPANARPYNWLLDEGYIDLTERTLLGRFFHEKVVLTDRGRRYLDDH